MFLARFVQSCAGYALGTAGASALVVTMLICFAVLLVGSGAVVQYVVDHFAAVKYLDA
jgi:hypothetical protein